LQQLTRWENWRSNGEITFVVAAVSNAALVASGRGAQRMVQSSDNIEEEYERLTVEGVTFLHSPQTVLGPDGRSG
jgi:hypothetical protein